ncbi:prepilin peptidase [Mordavella massiliensis]|uniref:Prepilin peptidase n=2 Tax=Mordavella massiliensis TaxID=1871024 RepID=A0A938X9D6_9CLOT|nr:prepilin peptidase [Mordavella massiliensis]
MPAEGVICRENDPGTACRVRDMTDEMIRMLGRAVPSALFLAAVEEAVRGDLAAREIPDRACLLLLLGGALAGLTGEMPLWWGGAALTWAERAAGCICVSLPMLLLDLRVPGAFGGGDVKLAAAGGFFLGWKSMACAGAVAVLTGGAAAAFLLLVGRRKLRDGMAFGPCLCLGMAAGYLWGGPMAGWFAG